MTSRRTSFENLSKSGWTLILETLSSPNMTFVVVVLIWYNSLVRIANRPFLFFNKHWAEAGVQIIKDLVNDDFQVITYGEFREKQCLSPSFLEFYGVTSAIRSAMKSLKLKTPNGKDQGFSVQKLIAATKPTKLAYIILIQKISTSPRKSQEKWVRDCDLEVVEDFS